MCESIDWDFIDNNRELIANMVGNFLGVFGKEYELTTVMTDELKTFIIDKSIIYASTIASEQANVSNFENCFTSQDINAVPPFKIPDVFRKNLEDEIDEVIQENLVHQKEKLFIVKPDEHLGRRDLLYKSIIYQIRLLHDKYIHDIKPDLPEDACYMPFEKLVDLHYEGIVNRTIQFVLCYEANNKDDDMCRKILVESALNEKNFHYRLEKHVDIELRKEIDNFLKTFRGKKFDLDIFNINKTVKILLQIINKSKKIDEDLKEILIKTIEESKEIGDADKDAFLKIINKELYSVVGAKESLVKKIKAISRDEFQEALLNTIGKAKKAIDEIFNFDKYEDCQKCREIRRGYNDLLENAEERVENPAKLKNFKVALQKAKLNYVSKYEDQYIYPFVYDLIVMSYSFAIKSELYNLHSEKTNILAKSINELKYKYLDKDSDENYIFEDLLQLIEVLPDEFKNIEPALLIIKHYSEILDVDYKAIANVLKQLRVKKADGGKTIYALPEKLRNTRLSIDDDYFRALSLDII